MGPRETNLHLLTFHGEVQVVVDLPSLILAFQRLLHGILVLLRPLLCHLRLVRYPVLPWWQGGLAAIRLPGRERQGEPLRDGQLLVEAS